LGVGEDQLIIRVAGDIPGILVNDLVVVVAQPDEVAAFCEATSRVELDVVDLIYTRITAREPAVLIPGHDRGAHVGRDGAHFGECGNDVAGSIYEERCEARITGKVLRDGPGDGGGGVAESGEPTHRWMISVQQIVEGDGDLNDRSGTGDGGHVIGPGACGGEVEDPVQCFDVAALGTPRIKGSIRVILGWHCTAC
jgi:hypothetical protein